MSLARRMWPGQRPDPGEDAMPPQIAAIVRLQRHIRGRWLYPGRLKCKTLCERLVFEADFLRGLFRFSNQALIFVLIIVSLYLSGDSSVKRGIYTNLRASFDLETVASVTDRETFVSESLPAISRESKRYFLLSSKYFSDGGSGDLELVRGLETFQKPRTINSVELNVQVPAISFTVWLQTSRTFSSGYIIRKLPQNVEKSANTACWGWYLTKFGPELHFGAHDTFGFADLATKSVHKQTKIAMDTRGSPFQLSERFQLLTVTISEDEVTFYLDLERLGSRSLPRPLTDCENAGAGFLVGSQGMQMGQLRFYTRALTISNIEEIYRYGNLLSNIATGSSPRQVEESEIDLLAANLDSGFTANEESIGQRQTLMERTSILDRVISEKRLVDPTAKFSPTFPHGVTDAGCHNGSGPILATDDVLNRSYYALIVEPARLSRTSNDNARYLRNVPNFVGTGVTFTFWFKHVQCEQETCGLYLLHAFDSSRAFCWSLWLENGAIWFDNPLGSPTFQYPKFSESGVSEDFHLKNDDVWRFIGFTLDEVSDTARFWLDGSLVWEGPWGSSVTGADCAGSDKLVALGHQHPGWTYGAEVEIHDFRMYVHSDARPDGSTGGSLSGSEMLALATAPTPRLADNEKCLDFESPSMVDNHWHDEFQHDCLWFWENAREVPSLCHLQEARANCPIACQSRQVCFSRKDLPPVYMVFNRTRWEAVHGGGKGSVCLGSHLTKQGVVQQCRDWVEQGVDKDQIAAWLDSFAAKSTKRIDMRNCDEIELAVDEHCTFDIEPVENFTKEVVANGGDFTIAFWVRSAPTHDGRFFPLFNFYASLTPPLHNLLIGRWENPNGEIRVNTDCHPGMAISRSLFENVELNRLQDREWNFISITRRNTSAPTETDVMTNLDVQSELQNSKTCFYNNSAMFHAIELDTDTRFTPIMLIPQALPVATAQSLYYRHAFELKSVIGPKMPNHERKEVRVEISKEDYRLKSTLMAPPIIFRTAASPSGCGYNYSSAFVARQYSKALEQKCVFPNRCDNSTISSPQDVLSCPVDTNVDMNSTSFGLEQQFFMGVKGYSDFLYSIIDNAFLFRLDSDGSGGIRSTSDFFDSLTTSVSVAMVFFTPDRGITTVMTVVADFTSPLETDVSVEIHHFEIIEGWQLVFYVVIQCLVLGNLLLLLVDTVPAVIDTVKDLLRGQRIYLSQVFQPVLDVASSALIIVYIYHRLPDRVNSAAKTLNVLGHLDDIPWDDPEYPVEMKRENFLRNMQDLLELIQWNGMVNALCNIILLISLFRVILCTSCHPRLALLTGTITEALDNLWHTLILLFMIMVGFAAIATWRFGNTRSDFSSLMRALELEFHMMVGELPDEWTETTELKVYVLLYMVVVFLLVLNFLLAIIVEGYMSVVDTINACEVEQEFFTDIFGTLYSMIKGRLSGWPRRKKLGLFLEHWKGKSTVGYVDLFETGMFRDHQAVCSFLRYYGTYDFLVPAPVGRYGRKEDNSKQNKEHEEIAKAIEARLKSVFRVKVPTLKEEALMAEQRKKLKLQRKRSGLASISEQQGETDQSMISPNKMSLNGTQIPWFLGGGGVQEREQQGAGQNGDNTHSEADGSESLRPGQIQPSLLTMLQHYQGDSTRQAAVIDHQAEQIDRQTCQIHEMMEKMDFLIDAVQPLLRRHTSKKVKAYHLEAKRARNSGHDSANTDEDGALSISGNPATARSSGDNWVGLDMGAIFSQFSKTSKPDSARQEIRFSKRSRSFSPKAPRTELWLAATNSTNTRTTHVEEDEHLKSSPRWRSLDSPRCNI